MASNKEDFQRIPIENKLISLRQLVNFHSKRNSKSHLPQVSNISSASVNLPGRNLQQKLWRLNWPNLFDRSTNQPLFPAVFTVL